MSDEDIEDLARHLCKQAKLCDPDDKVSTCEPQRGPKRSIIVRDSMLAPAWHLYITEAVAAIEWMDIRERKNSAANCSQATLAKDKIPS